MGIYDIYGQVQLKVGDIGMDFYEVGDKVSIPDGVYLGYEGIVVIKDGKFIAEFEEMTTKWGGTIKPADIVTLENPLNPVIEKAIKKAKKKRSK